MKWQFNKKSRTGSRPENKRTGNVGPGSEQGSEKKTTFGPQHWINTAYAAGKLVIPRLVFQQGNDNPLVILVLSQK